MTLKLTRPLVVFDLETTGLDISRDKIIQISYIKVGIDGQEKSVNLFVNPQMRISAEIEALTHITNDMLAGAPSFKDLAVSLCEDFKGCDFAGFNSNRFDIPMLAEEFLRAGIDFDFNSCRLIDASVIFNKMERRNLAAAYKFYCGRKMEDDFTAHRADEDACATWKVLQGQLAMYSRENQTEEERLLENDMEWLNSFCMSNAQNVDYAGRIVWAAVKGADGAHLLNADGTERRQEVFNFGKYKDVPVVDVLRRDPGYYSWMLSGDFTLNTKQVLTRIRLREYNKRNSQ